MNSATSLPWLIGLDDTDNPDSRGTGYRARELVKQLQHAGLARVAGVTRHQLLVDDRIPYTSHNSCACIGVEANTPPAKLFAFCREYMLEFAEDGSDVGLCLASPEAAARVAAFGRRAQREVLDQDDARATAEIAGIMLEGLTGTRDGIIGSLAGVGLFADGNDGRYIWKPRLRDYDACCVSVSELLADTGIDDVRIFNGPSLATQPNASINLGDWPRPVRIDGRSVLLVKQGPAHEPHTFHCLDKQSVKAFRP